MSDEVLLDAVSVATLARAARDVAASTETTADHPALQMLPDPIAESLRPHLEVEVPPAASEALVAYAVELDDIAEAAVALDQHEHEIEHQLRWWKARVATLEDALTGHPGDDVDTVRELALYRGRISGAETMRRHYVQQRRALVDRHARADTACVAVIAAL